MLRAVPFFVHQHARRQYSRQVVSRCSLRKQVTLTTPSSILAAYSKHCHDPALALLRRPAAPLHNDNAVDPAEYDKWASVANAPSLAAALTAVDRAYTAYRDADSAQAPRLPAWVLLSMLYKSPSSHIEAFVAYTLTVAYPITAAPRLLPLAILLSAYWLSTFRMYAPLRAMTRRFIHASEHLQPYHVSLLLRILAQAAPSTEVQHMIKLLLDLAIRNHMDLGVRTYRLILENRAASRPVADLVNSHMKDRGYTPNLSHTRALLRIYGRLGRRKTAARYWRLIRIGEYYGPREEYLNDPKHQAPMLEDTLHAYKNPRKLHLYVKFLLKATAHVQQEPDIAPSNHLPTLPGSTGIPKKVWMQVLRTAAEKSDTTSAHLLELFRSGIEHIGAPAKVIWAYFVAIKGLMRKREYEQAASLLKEVWDTRARWDARKVTMAVETLTMVNRPDVAFRLLLDMVGREALGPQSNPNGPMMQEPHPAQDEPSSKSHEAQLWDPQTFSPRGCAVDTRAVNSFMICLLRSSRPDAVFYIWDTMPTVFRVDPDATSFAILLKAARFARKCEGALQVVIADFGLSRILPRRNRTGENVQEQRYLDPQRLSKDEAVEGLHVLLRPDANRVVDGFWRGERAGDVALRVAWQVLVGNWPVLGTFKSPMRAVRQSADGQSSSPMSDLFRSFTSRDMDDDGEESVEASTGVVRPYDEDGRTFFGIVPEDMMFRALLDLLAEEDRAWQVPLVLTWMRYLMVRPSRDTLATALVYWGEVTLEGPWIERWKGEERSQYVRLLKWMTRWVGRGNMPERDQTQRALKRIRWFRDQVSFRNWSGREETADEDWGDGDV